MNQQEYHKNESFADEQAHFLTCPDPSGNVYQANYKIDKIKVARVLSGY